MSTGRVNALIEPFYFGAEKPLFGCYHRPQRQAPHSCAVVLCHAMGEEYIRFHRALRQLAVQLASAGFPVLRFDFYGCGDSAGEAEEWRIAQWQADLALAIAEARRRSGSSDVALAGLRLGATLAAAVGAARQDIAATVLWDAVLNGAAYLQELQSLHTRMLRSAHVRSQSPDRPIPSVLHPRSGRPRRPDEAVRPAFCAGPVPEVLGFPLCPALRADIAAIDLLALPGKPASQVLLVESDPTGGQAAFAEHLQRLGAGPELIAVPSPQLWLWQEGLGKVVVPHSILQTITSWLDRVYP